MSPTEKPEPVVPQGPVDPVAQAIAEAFSSNPAWLAVKENPLPVTREAIRSATPVSRQPEMFRVDDMSLAVDGGEVLLRCYLPSQHPSQVIVWAHGGGFALGSLDEIDSFIRLLAKETNSAVYSVGYRLAPEHRFPVAVDDMQAATLWVLRQQAELLGKDLPVFVGGDSAGGNLATVVTRKIHESKSFKLAGNILAYPCTDSPDIDSLRWFTPPFMSADEISWFADLYLPDPALRSHPDFACIRASSLELLPPTLFITAEHDLITAQANAYADRLRERGVDTRVSGYPGMIHGFLTMEPFFPGAAGEAIGAVREFIRSIVD